MNCSYSKALDNAEILEEKRLAHLNRSLVDLRLARPTKALSDAAHAHSPDMPAEMAPFRQPYTL